MTAGATFSGVRLANEAGRIVVFGVNEMALGQPKSKFSTNRTAPRLPVPLPTLRHLTPRGKQILKASSGGRFTSTKSSGCHWVNDGSRAGSLRLFPYTTYSWQVKELTCSHLLKWKRFFLECRLNSMVHHYHRFLALLISLLLSWQNHN